MDVLGFGTFELLSTHPSCTCPGIWFSFTTVFSGVQVHMVDLDGSRLGCLHSLEQQPGL